MLNLTVLTGLAAAGFNTAKARAPLALAKSDVAIALLRYLFWLVWFLFSKHFLTHI